MICEYCSSAAEHDAFAPNEPWNNRADHLILDATFADLERACYTAGKWHKWDAVHHQCVYKEAPDLPYHAAYRELPRGRGVTQEGPSRQAIDGGPVAGASLLYVLYLLY